MRQGSYPTPAQVWLIADGVWLDDAYRVEYRSQYPVIPLYGYDEKEFTAVAKGRQLVTGNLVINFRYPGYLYAAINGRTEAQIKNNKAMEIAQNLLTASVDDRIAILEDARQKGDDTEKRVIAMMKSLFAYSPTTNQTDEIMGYLRNQVLGTNIDIYFDKPEEGLYFRRIEGVRFSGEAMTISASANSGGDTSASGMPLYEIYTFIARKIIDIRTDKLKDRFDFGYKFETSIVPGEYAIQGVYPRADEVSK